MKKIFFKITKIIGIVLGSIIGLILLIWGGLNIAKFAIYSDYYSLKENICKNPGLNDGFVPQGIAVSEDDDLIITSGYMNDGTASRIYITNSKNESRFVTLNKAGKSFTGHVGGIALSRENVYIANSKKVYTISLTDLLAAEETIDIGSGQSVNNSASFIFADSNYLYVGEFHDGGKYITNHEVTTDDGKYYAICSQYAITDLSTPVKVFSIRNKVQGFCVTSAGSIVLSTSYGLTSSEYYIYESSDIKQTTEEYEGAPLYILDNYTYKISGPAMSEDLSYANGKVYCLTESACDKYIFGKFFFANHIYSLDIK